MSDRNEPGNVPDPEASGPGPENPQAEDAPQQEAAQPLQPLPSTQATPAATSSPTAASYTVDPNRLCPTPDPNCSYRTSHQLGVFCHRCRSMAMTWGTLLPLVRSSLGIVTERGLRGSILEGVALQNRQEVLIVALVAHQDVRGEVYLSINGLRGFLNRDPHLRTAGQRVARIYRRIFRAAGEGDVIPEFFDIMNTALTEPDMTPDQYVERITSLFGKEAGVAQPSERTALGEERRGNANEFGIPQGGGIGAGSWNAPPDPQTRDMGTQTVGGHEPRQGPVPPERRPSVDDNEDEAAADFTILPPTKKNAPGPTGITWTFAPGTDLTEAHLNQPDPSKFILIRINTQNPTQIDVRRHPHIAHFDWTSPHQIKALNKSRWQLRRRTTGSIGPPRLPWSEREKAELKRQIQQALESGQARNAIDWAKVTANMTEKFEGVVQRKGEKVARTDGVGVTERSYTALHQDRMGFERPATAVRNQAMKFCDVAELVRPSSLAEALAGGERKREMGVESEEEEEEEEEEDEEDDDSEDGDFGTAGKGKGRRRRPLQRRRRSPRSPPPRAPKKPPRPPPPPPGSGSGTVSGAGPRLRLSVRRPLSTN